MFTFFDVTVYGNRNACASFESLQMAQDYRDEQIAKGYAVRVDHVLPTKRVRFDGGKMRRVKVSYDDPRNGISE